MAAYAERAVALGVRCSLSIPLTVDGSRVLGALNVYGYDRPREFGVDERRRVEQFATQAAMAIALAVRRSEQQAVGRQLEKALHSRAATGGPDGVPETPQQDGA